MAAAVHPDRVTRLEINALHGRLDSVIAALVLAGIDVPTTPGADVYVAKARMRNNQ